MTTYGEAIENERAIKTATDLYRRDARFHALTLRVAMAVIKDFGPVNPDEIDRDVHEIAIRSAAQMLACVYTEDAEIMTLRAERDVYKKLAEETISLSPRPFTFKVLPDEPR